MICRECNIDKDIVDFYLKKNGKVKSLYCKVCYNLTYKANKENRKEYYENNKEKFLLKNKEWSLINDRTEYRKEYYEKNKEIITEKNKQQRKENSEQLRQYNKQKRDSLSDEQKKERNEKNKINYHNKREQYRESKNKYVSERRNNDPLFKLIFNIRTLIRNSFNRKFTSKSKKTIEILGCSFEEFYKHLENKFDYKMNWENQGTYWHMDHIIPISSAKTEEEIYKLNHYTNFQPLYWEDNLKKSNIQ